MTNNASSTSLIATTTVTTTSAEDLNTINIPVNSSASIVSSVPHQMCPAATSPDMTPIASDSDNNSPGSPQLTVFDIILNISQAHRSFCTYTDERIHGLVRNPITYPIISEIKEENAATSISEQVEKQKIWLWQQFAQKVVPGVQQIVEFAKRVPGFCDFTQDDKLILIKLGFFELWLCHIAKTTTDTSLTFDDGTFLTRQQIEIMYDIEYANDLFNFCTNFNSFNMNDTEIGLFTAFALMTADRPGITEPKTIIRTRDKIFEALRVQILRMRPNTTNNLQIISELEAKIPELHNLGARHSAHLDWIRSNWMFVRLPPLFAEIFDIPKSEDDLLM